MREKVVLILSEHGVGQKEILFDELSDILESRYHILTRYPTSLDDMLNVVKNNTRVCGVVFDWDHYSIELCQSIEKINENMPLFAFTNQHAVLDVKLSDLSILRLNFFEYKLQEIESITRKIKLTVSEYLDYIIPPLTKALFKYVSEGKYTFCTPGHMGGSAFLKSPTGAVFYDFYGANTFEGDISISVPELGSLLDHTGPHKQAEEFIAKVFGADKSYMVTNGTSTANKIVGMFSVTAGDTMLMDRNCHKSLTHLMMMVDVKPLYFKPTRNAYGILGGIPKSEFTPDVIKKKMAAIGAKTPPVYAVVTNSTYDGLFYNTDYIKTTLECKHIHLDSAWVPYTHFHEIYKGKAGMSGVLPADKVIFETHSTHKLLAAFSQASMIHIKGKIDEDCFNEPYMMHTSTSPQYNMVASCEVAAAMMKGNSGRRLIEESLKEALHFRQQVTILAKESEGWFYKVWQPDNVSKVDCWPLKSSDSWHGFKNIDENHMYLDPIKVTLILPGLKDGKMEKTGIPAAIVAKYLDEYGVIVEKTGPYSMLFLFSVGIDKARSLKLLHTLVDFKRAFDANLKVKDIIPALYEEDTDFYENMTLQEIAQGVHEQIVKYDLPDIMFKAFDVLPEMTMTPYQAYQEIIRGNTENVPLKDMAEKICAHMILPYPPGVPLVLPGEKMTGQSKVVLEFLEMLVNLGQHYPGFATDIHGLHEHDGEFFGTVVKV